MDFTERFRAEKDRRATAILESTTDAFFALDRDWRFTYVNRQAELVLTRSRYDLIGKVIWDVFPGLEGSSSLPSRDTARRKTVDARARRASTTIS
jgi:two-component system, sensor histidine kinase